MEINTIAFAATKVDAENRGLSSSDASTVAVTASLLGPNPMVSLLVGRAMADRKLAETSQPAAEQEKFSLVPPDNTGAGTTGTAGGTGAPPGGSTPTGGSTTTGGTTSTGGSTTGTAPTGDGGPPPVVLPPDFNDQMNEMQNKVTTFIAEAKKTLADVKSAADAARDSAEAAKRAAEETKRAVQEHAGSPA